ncbi:TonB-dependent receptor plug domain-containing protein [Flavobacteriaceae bacterium]|nr:TonB-dependent receptor plug domain-containing protein [Flavobacteriaceae bacterium]
MHKKTNTLRRASVLGLAFICVSVSLPAEAIEPDAATTQELLPYVVVATRTPLGLDRVSPSISYISAEEMKLWQGRALSDVLTQEAGMVVVSSGAKGAQTSLFTRGTNSDHTAFFLDGRRLNSGFGNQYGLERLSLDNLSSVQIQKGASSVNYGSSGIGGVVDLRSRSAFDVDGNTATLSGEAGSNDYAGGAFSTALSEERLGVSVSGSALTTENERKNDDYKYEGVSSRIDYLLTDTLSLELVGQYDYTEKELPGSTVAPSPFDEQNSEDWLVSPGIRYATDELTVHVFYSHSESHIDLYQEKGAYDEFGNYLGDFPVSNDSEVKSDEVNLQVDYSVSDDLLITTGMVYRNDDVTNSNLNIFNPLEDAIPYDERFEQFGIYAQALWLVTEALELRG